MNMPNNDMTGEGEMNAQVPGEDKKDLAKALGFAPVGSPSRVSVLRRSRRALQRAVATGNISPVRAKELLEKTTEALESL